MQSITELIDTIHELEDGVVVTVETDDETYRGVITRIRYTAPKADEIGHIGVEISVDNEDGAGGLLELRTAASASQKFPRPELYAGGFETTTEDEPLGTVADLTVAESDT